MRNVVLAFFIGIAATASAQTQPEGPKPAPQSQMDHGMMMMMMDAELAYLMARHHRDGIEMTKLEESAGSSSEVKALAAKIRQGQERDLPTLEQYGAKAKKGGMVASKEKQIQQEHEASMEKLKSASGAALDKAFAAEMSKHHQKAMEMMKQAHLMDAKLKQLTDKMSVEQKQELQELKKAM